jgi:hypothetical protein
VGQRWTDTLTLFVNNKTLEQTHERVMSAALRLDLEVEHITTRRRRGMWRSSLDVRLTGTPDHISDFEEVFAGDGWTLDLVDPLLGEMLNSALLRIRRARRARRARTPT